MPKDLYVVLGVTRGANLKNIKEAYRASIKKYHPDITRTEESTARFLEVKEAYETLSDEARRKRHDEDLAGEESGPKISRAFETAERGRAFFDQTESIFSSFTDEFFEGFLPGFFEFDKSRTRQKDLYFEAVLSPSEAARGGLFPVTVPVIEPCPRCSETGFRQDLFCPVCSGYGRVKSEREFSLSIPPHVKNGTEIRLSMDDIGLRGVFLNILVTVDSGLGEEWW